MTRLAFVASFVLLAACAAPAKKQRGAECELNSECDTPLVCRIGACRKECATTRDCAAGTQCLLDDAGLGACQLETELHCARTSECTPPLVCANGACADACREDRDCPPGAGCVAGDGGVRGCVDVATHPCVRDSECAWIDAGTGTRLVCARDGRCRIECASDRECRYGTHCIAGSCGVGGASPDGGAMDAGTGDGATGDAGATDAGATDADTDSGTDAGTDAGADAGTDAGTDAGADAGADAGTDAGTDAGACPGGIPSTAVQVAVGQQFACARLSGGTVWCWGNNMWGQLGPAGAAGYSPFPVQVTGVSGATFIAAGTSHACAASATGLLCWGRNTEGQLGDGTMVSSATPVTATVAAPRFVAASVWNTCAIDGAGVLWCWGWRNNGSMGDGMPGNLGYRLTPTPVTIAAGVLEVAVTTLGACALLPTGLQCWGQNDHGQTSLGGGPVLSPTPAGVPPPLHVRASQTHVCAQLSSGATSCWGGNGNGQLGDGTTAFSRPTPMIVAGVPASTGGAVGSSFSCAALGAGVKCWGGNGNGQLGDGTTTDRTVPVDVVGLPGSTLTWIDAGVFSACVVTTTGDVYCWGLNDSGQLGPAGPAPSPTALSTSPVHVTCLP